MGRTTPIGRIRCECILRQLITISGMLWKMVFPQSHLLWMLLMWRDSSNSTLKRRISYVAIWAKDTQETARLLASLSLRDAQVQLEKVMLDSVPEEGKWDKIFIFIFSGENETRSVARNCKTDAGKYFYFYFCGGKWNKISGMEL